MAYDASAYAAAAISLRARYAMSGTDLAYAATVLAYGATANQRMVLRVGDGKTYPQSGDLLTMHYKGTLASDGSVLCHGMRGTDVAGGSGLWMWGTEGEYDATGACCGVRSTEVGCGGTGVGCTEGGSGGTEGSVCVYQQVRLELRQRHALLLHDRRRTGRLLRLAGARPTPS
eukprot:2888337-Rhodomonas_salina.3